MNPFNVRRIAKLAVIAMLFAIIGLLSGCGTIISTPVSSSSPQNAEQHNAENTSARDEAAADAEKTAEVPLQALTSFEEVAAYIREHGELPENFITKNEAQKRGWVASEGNLHDVAPGMSIGGDRFGNREGLLPAAEGRVWYEADINYNGGHRNADRIVFSNDGLIYMTTDHYKSFTDITEGID
ncbi:ribonuclease domain-containing protein [Paenibacillus septentrionalis]|uniref:Ribonuclease n=1 Tax=Paenibacillus septentrionalis TaxID=429342 RepID=A0ABW1VAJ7_9BACL